ncbi:hypothetical protein ZWY2020_014860 [Hordeum vulgare]|nr:hypothetical protein ZWY2020_014860 [Hordeum vulgare]
MVGSHTLTVSDFFELNGVLRSIECTHTMQFSMGGSGWFLKLCPYMDMHYMFRFLFLVCTSNNEPPMMVEFGFELEGVINSETQKVTYTFDCANPKYEFLYLLEPSMPTMHGCMPRSLISVGIP